MRDLKQLCALKKLEEINKKDHEKQLQTLIFTIVEPNQNKYK